MQKLDERWFEENGIIKTGKKRVRYLSVDEALKYYPLL